MAPENFKRIIQNRHNELDAMKDDLKFYQQYSNALRKILEHNMLVPDSIKQMEANYMNTRKSIKKSSYKIKSHK